MQLVSVSVHVLLAVLVMATVIVSLWRFSTLRQLKRLDPRDLAPIEKLIQQGDIDLAIVRSEALPRVAASIVGSTVQRIGDGREAAEFACRGALVTNRLELETGQVILATIGNNAPFVGLLGTVLSVVQAFAVMSSGPNDASTQPQLIAAISEALIATALGLVVALPAIAVHNWLQRKIDLVLGDAEAAALVCISQAPSHAGGARHGRPNQIA